ncbi:MAG: Xaa-Pro aminopeptidase [Bacilli bacterium]|nr:Xaa-Pro aminopeptidase [Bacilli bacterium]
MENKYFVNNRLHLKKELKNNSLAIIYSGYLLNKSADEEYKFQVNLNFFYLTNISQANSYLLMGKIDNKYFETLVIDPFDPFKEKWTGKTLTKEEAKNISGIENVIDEFDLKSYLDDHSFKHIYLDLEDNSKSFVNFNSFGLTVYQQIKDQYDVIDIYPSIIELRRVKQKYELSLIKESIKTTKNGLKNLMKKLKPNKYEYQSAADFDYVIKYDGNKDHSFRTIAASGVNATTLHYDTNHNLMEDGSLLLLDLGCKTNEYCSDISRTYPINGKFSERQKEIYNIVLKANEHCIKVAKDGMTFKELNDECKKVLFDGLKEIGKITEFEELDNYYYHGVSHSLGLDTHDPVNDRVIKNGMVITIEPGLYIKEEKIGIRIEDDIVINEKGNINLSKDIIKSIDDIEKFMAK